MKIISRIKPALGYLKGSLLGVWIFCFFNNLHAQTPVFRYYNEESGLSDHTVYALYKHHNGQVFIGTGSGVDLFDGLNLLPLNRHDQTVRDIVAYHKDTIIVVRSNSVLLINTTNYTFREADFSDSIDNSLNGAVVVGNTLYCSSNNGLVRISLENFHYQLLSKDHLDKEGEPFRTFRKSIVYDPISRSIYMGHRLGLIQYSLVSGSIYSEKNNPAQNRLLLGKNLLGEMVYQDGSIWLLADERNILEYQITENITTKHPLPAHFPDVKQIFPDGEYVGLRLTQDSFAFFNVQSGRFYRPEAEPGKTFAGFRMMHLSAEMLLFAGVKGIAVLENHARPVELLFDLSEDFGGRTEFQEVIRLHDGYYIHFKEGLAEYDSRRNTCTPLYPEYGVKTIYQIRAINADTLLLAGSGGYECYNVVSRKFFKPAWFDSSTEQVMKEKSILSMHYDSVSGRLVMNVNREGTFMVNLKNGKRWKWNGSEHGAFRSIRSILYNGNDTYVLGAQGNDGMAQVMMTDQGVKLLHYLPPRLFHQAGFHTGIINDILPYQGQFYIATTSGVGKVNFARKEIRKIKLTEGGTYNAEIYALSMVKGKLMASGRFLLFELEPDGSEMRKILSSSYSGFLGAVFHDGKDWCFLSDARLFRFRYDRPLTHQGLFISHAAQCGRLHNLEGSLRYKVKECPGEVMLYFSLKNYAGSEVPFEIQYRMDPDAGWQDLKGSVLSLPEIENGTTYIEYRIKQWGRSGPISRLEIYKSPPWYERKTAQAGILLFAILLSALVSWLIIRMIKKRNARNMQVLFNSIEEERMRMGREFHDAIGPNLSTIKLLAEYIVNEEQVADPRIRRLPDLADKTIAEIRAVISDISPEILKSNGLLTAVCEFADQLRLLRSGLHMEIQSNLQAQRFPSHIELHLYRIIQELVHNIIKHAGASYCFIGMERSGRELKILVKDNGRGIAEEASRKGNGLRNVRSRIALLKGSISIKTSDIAGTEFDLRLYLPE